MSSPETPGGVIHDIGYRRYDGPRLGRGAIARSLFGTTLRSTYGLGRTAKSKALPFILLGVMLLPALILQIVLIVGRQQAASFGPELLSEQLLPYTSYALVTQAVVWLYLAVQAPQVFSRDLRFATISLYFSRPMTRPDYVIAKYGALAGGLLILMIAPLIVMYIGGLLAGLGFGQETAGLARGITGAVILALLLTGLGALISSITVRRGFAIAAIITVGMVSLGLAGAVQGIGLTMGSEAMAAAGGLLSPTSLLDGVQQVLFGAHLGLAELTSRSGLWALVYLGVTVLLIAGSFALLLLRYRKVSKA